MGQISGRGTPGLPARPAGLWVGPWIKWLKDSNRFPGDGSNAEEQFPILQDVMCGTLASPGHCQGTAPKLGLVPTPGTRDDRVPDMAYHGETFLRVAQVVSDPSGGQQVGEPRHLVDDLALRHHDEHDGNQREASEGADDVEGVLGRGVVAPPGDGAGQAVGLGDVGAPPKQGEAGPHGGHQPDAAARYADVSPLQPHRCREEQKPADGGRR